MIFVLIYIFDQMVREKTIKYINICSFSLDF